MVFRNLIGSFPTCMTQYIIATLLGKCPFSKEKMEIIYLLLLCFFSSGQFVFHPDVECITIKTVIPQSLVVYELTGNKAQISLCHKTSD